MAIINKERNALVIREFEQLRDASKVAAITGLPQQQVSNIITANARWLRAIPYSEKTALPKSALDDVITEGRNLWNFDKNPRNKKSA